MRNFQGNFETRKRSFISTFSICMTFIAILRNFHTFTSSFSLVLRDIVISTAQKMKFSIKDFFNNVTKSAGILNGKLHFLCSDQSYFLTCKFAWLKILLLNSSQQLKPYKKWTLYINC